MENRPRKKLSRKMIGICSGFALILSVVLGSLGFYTYYHNIVDQYQQYIDTIIHICRSYIDADDMKECIDTGVKSAQYEETQKFLDNIKNNSQVEFIYVIKPLNDGAVDQRHVCLERRGRGGDRGVWRDRFPGRSVRGGLSRRHGRPFSGRYGWGRKSNLSQQQLGGIWLCADRPLSRPGFRRAGAGSHRRRYSDGGKSIQTCSST